MADYLGLHYSTVSRLINEGNLKIPKLKTDFLPIKSNSKGDKICSGKGLIPSLGV